MTTRFVKRQQALNELAATQAATDGIIRSANLSVTNLYSRD